MAPDNIRFVTKYGRSLPNDAKCFDVNDGMLAWLGCSFIWVDISEWVRFMSGGPDMLKARGPLYLELQIRTPRAEYLTEIVFAAKKNVPLNLHLRVEMQRRAGSNTGFESLDLDKYCEELQTVSEKLERLMTENPDRDLGT